MKGKKTVNLLPKRGSGKLELLNEKYNVRLRAFEGQAVSWLSRAIGYRGNEEIRRRDSPYSFGNVSALAKSAPLSINPRRQATSSGHPIFNP